MAEPNSAFDPNAFLQMLLQSLFSGGGNLQPGFTNPEGATAQEILAQRAKEKVGRTLTVQEANKDQPYIGLLDTRTPNMMALESAGLFPMLQSLLNPTWLAQSVLGQTGAAPGLAGGQGAAGMGNFLFGGGGGNPPDVQPGNPGDTPPIPGNGPRNSQQVQFKATGGYLDPNATTVVGERGPEIIPPAQGGRQAILPMQGATGGGGLGTTLATNLMPAATGGGGPTTTSMTLNGQSAYPPSEKPMTSLESNIPPRLPNVGSDYNEAFQFFAKLLGHDQGLPWGQTSPSMLNQANTMAQNWYGDQIAANGGTYAPGMTSGGASGVPNSGQFSTGTAQGPGTGSSAAAARGNNGTGGSSGGLLQQLLGQGNPGQGTVDAMGPVFNQNLQNALAQLRNTAPSVFNSGIGVQGTDLARQALNDFNLMGSQALQQGYGTQLQGALGAGGLAENSRQFNSQFGLAQQNQNWNQLMGPTLQLLLAAMGLSEPTAYQPVVGSQKA